MAIAEIFLSAFLQALFVKLASREFLEFVCGEGLRSKLNKLKDNLQVIQAVLSDAEEKQLTLNSVKIWLANLQDLAYDAEDLLDEFATEDLRRKIMAKDHAGSSRLQNVFSRLTPSAPKFDASMKSKMKAINSRLDELCKQRASLGLQTTPGGTPTVVQRLPTTSLPIEPAVYGRNEDKAKILELVLRDEPTADANFSVIPIVGMGGLGKTTLARLVYNDEATKGFDLRAWVCVSDEFDVFRISKVILEAFTDSLSDHKDLNLVQVKLKERIAGQRFLLVLDDVWSKDYESWETLKSPFKAGASGSKILVTTRHGDVASTMGTTNHYNLEILSDDDCWSLFEKHAFQGRDIGAYQNLQLFREKVVEKCKGLPLAAKTLGGLLRSKHRNDEWERILNSKMWNLSDESGILPVLRLSYYHLPSHLKRCFAYCAILPKDYEFEEEELVLLWMAEGLIQQSNGNEQMEDHGREYFRDLLSRSLFQQSNSENSKFVMHDLVNDMAKWISGETSFRLDGEAEIDKQSKAFDKVRQSSYIRGYYDDNCKLVVFYQFERTRTFLPILFHFNMSETTSHYISNATILDLLPKLKRLRALSLKAYVVYELPTLIGGLRHLRYLNLCRTMIKCLPESTSSLFNLQTLLLRDCPRLMKLPSKMRNLINLRHLDISGENLIKEMPLGIEDLKCLQTLSNFIVGKNTGSSLKDLKSLNHLHGGLCISALENAIDLQDIREGLLSDKKNLETLLLEWGSVFDDSRNEVVEKNVLDLLQPHRNLKELKIKGYGGTLLSSWITDPSFSNMVVVRLENCEKCSALPSLGLLCSLKDLTIEGMRGLRSIGSEFYGEGNSESFQSLEILRLQDLLEWENWDPVEENDHVERFPCLRELYIEDCPKFSKRLPGCLSSLEILAIRNCFELVVSLSSASMLREIIIDGCKRIVYSGASELQLLRSMALSNVADYGNWLRQAFPNVVSLRIGRCEDMAHLWENEISVGKPPQGFHSFNSLGDLQIEGCSSLISFPDASFFSNLRELEVKNCSALTSLPEGMTIERLRIEGCSSLVSFPDASFFSNLRELEVNNCNALTSLPEGMTIECLRIEGCSSLVSFPNASCSFFSNLRELEVRNCSALTSLPEVMTIEHLRIQGCHSLTFIIKGQLPSSLKEVNVSDCKKLQCFLDDKEHSLASSSCCLSPSSVLQRRTSVFVNLSVNRCPSLICISSTGQLPKSLQWLDIYACPKLESIAESFLNNSFIESILIGNCKNLKSLPNGLHNLSSLEHIYIDSCPSLVSLPEGGFPTRLKSLSISNVNLIKPLFEWGLHKLTSLRRLTIRSCPDAVSFPQEEIGMVLPPSLIYLEIRDFPKLKYLSSKGFQNLTNLKSLSIYNCPQLKYFPEPGFPSSLWQLWIISCSLVEKRCKRNKGKEWSKISHLPRAFINGRPIHAEENDDWPYP